MLRSSELEARLRLYAGSYALLLVSSCVDTSLPEPIYESELLTFAHDADLRVCGGTTAHLELLISEASRAAALDSIEPITFYWLSPQTYAERGGCDVPNACYRIDQHTVYSTFVPALHEVAHAVVHGAGLNPHPSLDEGLAHILEEPLPTALEVQEDVELLEVLQYDGERHEFPERFRGRSAHFVSFLAERYGVPLTIELLRQSKPGDLSIQDDVFAAVLSDDLDSVLQAYSDYPLCEVEEMRVAIAECAIMPTAWGFDSAGHSEWRFSAEPRCSDRDAVGTHLHDAFWSVRTFEIEEGRTFTLSATGARSDDRVVRVGRCGSSCSAPLYFRLYPGEETEVSLGPGRYYVESILRTGAVGEIGLRVVEVGPTTP